MGLQKYRADRATAQADGATLWHCDWMGGPTLAKIAACRIDNRTLLPRMVYITGDADSWFSTPAACRVKGKVCRGYVTGDDAGFVVFRAFDGEAEEFRAAS